MIPRRSRLSSSPLASTRSKKKKNRSFLKYPFFLPSTIHLLFTFQDGASVKTIHFQHSLSICGIWAQLFNRDNIRVFLYLLFVVSSTCPTILLLLLTLHIYHRHEILLAPCSTRPVRVQSSTARHKSVPDRKHRSLEKHLHTHHTRLADADDAHTTLHWSSHPHPTTP